jgi:hypothetical protein
MFILTVTVAAVSAVGPCSGNCHKPQSQATAAIVTIKPTKPMQSYAPAFESATVGFGKGKYPVYNIPGPDND